MAVYFPPYPPYYYSGINAETLPDYRSGREKQVERCSRVAAVVGTIFAVFPAMRWGAALFMRSVSVVGGLWGASRAQLANKGFSSSIRIALAVPAVIGLTGFIMGKMSWMIGSLALDSGLRLLKTARHFVDKQWRQMGESLAIATISAVAALALATLSIELLMTSMLLSFGFFLYRSVINESRGEYLGLACDIVQSTLSSWMMFDMAITDSEIRYTRDLGNGESVEVVIPPYMEIWPKGDFATAPLATDACQYIADIRDRKA